jgi:uncharacterized membrane protein
VRFARPALAFLATSWIVLVSSAPSAVLGVPLSGLIYAFGSFVCHQRPERSFHVGLAQLPVCARCYGLYLGAAAGALAAVLVSSAFRRHPLRPARADLRMLLLVATLPTAITWVLEVASLWAPSNTTRFIAALPVGIAVALTVNYVECARPQRNESRLPPTPI